MADYLVQEEDGTSKFTLEEGGGFILLEESTEGGAAIQITPKTMIKLGSVT